MKRKTLLPLGLLAPGILAAACVASKGQQIYAQGIYSAGTTYFGAGSTTLLFPPYHYDLTEISWREDEAGLTIIDIGHKPEPGDISRRCLEVKSGHDDYFVPMDSYPMRYFKSKGDPHIVKGSGDFASILTQCLANRTGRPITNALPVIQTSWIYGVRTNADIFFLDSDHYGEIESLLERAYGKPDGAVRSSEFVGGNCCSTNYSPAQIGVFLNLARTWDSSTIVSIIRTNGP